jgi:hypothetical protein
MSESAQSIYFQVVLRRPLPAGDAGQELVEALAEVFDRAEREAGGRICLTARGGDGGREATGAALVRLLLAAAVRHGAKRERRTQVRAQDAIWSPDGRCHLLAHLANLTQ